MAATSILDFRNLKFLTVATVKKVELRHRAKFHWYRANRGRDIAIFRFFKMAAAAILDFWNFKFLTERSRVSNYVTEPNWVWVFLRPNISVSRLRNARLRLHLAHFSWITKGRVLCHVKSNHTHGALVVNENAANAGWVSVWSGGWEQVWCQYKTWMKRRCLQLTCRLRQPVLQVTWRLWLPESHVLPPTTATNTSALHSPTGLIYVTAIFSVCC